MAVSSILMSRPTWHLTLARKLKSTYTLPTPLTSKYGIIYFHLIEMIYFCTVEKSDSLKTSFRVSTGCFKTLFRAGETAQTNNEGERFLFLFSVSHHYRHSSYYTKYNIVLSRSRDVPAVAASASTHALFMWFPNHGYTDA